MFSIDSNLHLKQPVLSFWTKFVLKNNFCPKQGKWTLPPADISLGINFHPKQFWLSNQNCPRRRLLVETRKSEYDHRIEHIRIRQRTKFDLTQILLIFLDQIFPKRVFSIQNRKSEHHHRIQHIQISMDVILNKHLFRCRSVPWKKSIFYYCLWKTYF